MDSNIKIDSLLIRKSFLMLNCCCYRLIFSKLSAVPRLIFCHNIGIVAKCFSWIILITASFLQWIIYIGSYVRFSLYMFEMQDRVSLLFSMPVDIALKKFVDNSLHSVSGSSL